MTNETFFSRLKATWLRAWYGFLFFVQHALAAMAVVVALALGFIWPVWFVVVHLNGRFMTPSLGFEIVILTVPGAMLSILIIYTIFRCYWEDKMKGAPKEH